MEPSRCIKSYRVALFFVVCGLFCLVYMANFHKFGEDISLRKIRKSVEITTTKVDTSRKGVHETGPSSVAKTITKRMERMTTRPLISTVPFTTSSAATTTKTPEKAAKTSNSVSVSAKTSTPITKEESRKGERASKDHRAERDLLTLESYTNYPPFVKPKTLKTLSLPDLKALSKNFSFANPHVVRIIHQSWKTTTLPPRFVKWSKTWKEKFPDWDYKLWDDANNLRLVANLFPWFLSRYNRLPRGVQRADAVRYLYLFAQGGIYADLDDECLKPFEHLIKKDVIAFGSMAGNWYQRGHPSFLEEGYVQNSFMYSVPGHPFWLDVVETIMKRPSSSSPEGTTGPFMLQEVIGRWRKANPKRRKDIHIYAPVYFNPFSWIHKNIRDCKDVGSMTSREIAACKAHFNESYVIQYHTQTWGRGAGNTNRNDRRRL